MNVSLRIMLAIGILAMLATSSCVSYREATGEHYAPPKALSPGNYEYSRKYMAPSRYPDELCTRGNEGYVVIEFIIDASGAVKNPTIVETDNEKTYGELALQRMRETTYYPRIVDGEPVSLSGVKVLLKYCCERNEAQLAKYEYTHPSKYCSSMTSNNGLQRTSASGLR